MSAQFDVIVVGAGNAAFCAALAAREKGASVLMLERAPEAYGLFRSHGAKVLLTP